MFNYFRTGSVNHYINPCIHSDYTKAVQPSPVNREVKVLEEILDTLDVKSFIPPMNFGNGPTDSLLDDPIWKKMFLVEPIPLKDEDLLGEDPGEDLEGSTTVFYLLIVVWIRALLLALKRSGFSLIDFYL